MQKMLFLGYDRMQTSLIEKIEQSDWVVDHTAEPVVDFSDYDLVVSFGYRFILKTNTLTTARRPVINLHIAYLPWNRGAHPLFWAAYDGTPAGVTIHEMDQGVDTGPICFQNAVRFDYDKESFASAYKRLIGEVEDLFLGHLQEVLGGNYVSTPQVGAGTVRRVRDLPGGLHGLR
jgi:methionyl-tRNA formyltransferase